MILCRYSGFNFFPEANKVIDQKDIQNQLQAILNQPHSHKIKEL